MSGDLVALCRRRPDAEAVAAALLAAGGDLRVQPVEAGAALQLVDGEGVPVLVVEGALLVQVPGEVHRLLGPAVQEDAPVWWVEIRATTHPAGAGAGGRLADALVGALGGSVWGTTS